MSLLSKLFGNIGGEKAAAAQPEEYKGFRIFPEPQSTGNQFRVAGRIEKEIGGQTRTHDLIRADVVESRATALEVTVAKAKALIDEQGETIFD